MNRFYPCSECHPNANYCPHGNGFQPESRHARHDVVELALNLGQFVVEVVLRDRGDGGPATGALHKQEVFV